MGSESRRDSVGGGGVVAKIVRGLQKPTRFRDSVGGGSARNFSLVGPFYILVFPKGGAGPLAPPESATAAWRLYVHRIDFLTLPFAAVSLCGVAGLAETFPANMLMLGLRWPNVCSYVGSTSHANVGSTLFCSLGLRWPYRWRQPFANLQPMLIQRWPNVIQYEITLGQR